MATIPEKHSSELANGKHDTVHLEGARGETAHEAAEMGHVATDKYVVSSLNLAHFRTLASTFPAMHSIV